MSVRRERLIAQFTALRITLAVTALMIGAALCFFPWHKPDALFFLNNFPIPWWVYGTALLIGAVCLSIPKTRPWGYLIGAIVYTFFTLGIWLSVLGGLNLHIAVLSSLNFPPTGVSEFFAASNVSTICVLYWSALRAAIYRQVDEEEPVFVAKR